MLSGQPSACLPRRTHGRGRSLWDMYTQSECMTCFQPPGTEGGALGWFLCGFAVQAPLTCWPTPKTLRCIDRSFPPVLCPAGSAYLLASTKNAGVYGQQASVKDVLGGQVS